MWFTGLSWLIQGLARLQALSDRRLLWLREQYMQLYHEDGYCCGPLAADAIRVSIITKIVVIITLNEFPFPSFLVGSVYLTRRVILKLFYR